MPAAGEAIKIVTVNREARHLYLIEETLEAGLALVGSEVKSLRQGGCSLKEAYAKVEAGEVWLVGCHIAPYAAGGYANHDPLRSRKLLLHTREIRRLAGKVAERGYTLVPMKIYFKQGRAKIEIGLAKGKRKPDRRAEIKGRDVQRDLERELKGR